MRAYERLRYLIVVICVYNFKLHYATASMEAYKIGVSPNLT